MQKKNSSEVPRRYLEIDILRGIAIFMMITYHFFWDLSYFYTFDITTPEWKIFQITTASLFIFLVGVSLTLSLGNFEKFGKKDSPLREGGGWNFVFTKLLKRGTYIFSLGLLITLTTRILNIGSIHFGILHFIGVSIILSYPFLKFKKLNIFLGIIFILIGQLITQFFFKEVEFFYPAVILGITPGNYISLDYFPIFPWFGVVLIGIFLGNSFYTSEGRKFPFSLDGADSISKVLRYFGRHSLMIYLVHQPIIFGLLYFGKHFYLLF